MESVRYGDQLSGNENSVANIKDQIEKHHKAIHMIDPRTVTEQAYFALDTRIHCLFYLMTPHRLKAIDLLFIEQLSPYVTIVPIIAKADALTLAERSHFFNTIDEKLSLHAYATICDSGRDEPDDQRHYLWGKVNSASPRPSDLQVLQQYLFESGNDLICISDQLN